MIDKKSIARALWGPGKLHSLYNFLPSVFHQNGGGERDRTDDLLNANQALSQLSYTPVLKAFVFLREAESGGPRKT
jgi:hypothetical protein